MIPCLHCRGEDSIPGQVTKIPMPSSSTAKKKKKKLQYKPPWYRARAQMQILYRRDAYNLIFGWSTELFLYTQLGMYSFIPTHTHTHTHTLLAHWYCALYTSSLHSVRHFLISKLFFCPPLCLNFFISFHCDCVYQTQLRQYDIDKSEIISKGKRVDILRWVSQALFHCCIHIAFFG